MTTDPRFEEFLTTLQARVRERRQELAGDEGEGTFTEEAFTSVVLEILEDQGQVPGAELCYLEQKVGRGIARVNAHGIDLERGHLDLVTTCHGSLESGSSLGRAEINQAATRALRVVEAASAAFHLRMEPASPAHDMVRQIHDSLDALRSFRMIILTDSETSQPGTEGVTLGELEATVDVWDLRRLFRLCSSGLPYEPIEIDLVPRLGMPLPCLQLKDASIGYEVYLTLLPAHLIAGLYHEYGPRLLELNVRSFLQARNKVNRGIRDTLRTDASMFLAYNNGLTATAETIRTSVTGDLGLGLGITHITGLQIVNGGQTVASIHRAKLDRVDLSRVYVQAKITRVDAAHIDTLVPLISKYANTQNRVNDADFSANHPFHVKLQKLSETTWSPGQQSRWFYERARGQFQVARARESTTPARKRSFDQTTPANQKFDKVLLAKSLNSWAELPHLVSRGNQKNFIHFMDLLSRESPAGWEPDEAYFRAVIAHVLIFTSAERIARRHRFPAYRANAVAYTVSLLAYRTAGRIDLSRIWDRQGITEAMESALDRWMPEVHRAIVESAAGKNVTEWCKNESCWRHMQTLPLDVPGKLLAELADGQPLPTVGDVRKRDRDALTQQERDNIARVMMVPSEEWIHISGWGTRTGALQDWQSSIAATLAAYAAGGWKTVPSTKQAYQGVKILDVAARYTALTGPDS